MLRYLFAEHYSLCNLDLGHTEIFNTYNSANCNQFSQIKNTV